MRFREYVRRDSRCGVVRRLAMTALGLSGCVLAVGLSSDPARAQSPTDALPAPLALEDVIRIARARRPEVVAAEAAARAARARPPVVGSLGDPMVVFNLDHLPIPVMGANVQAMAMQQFPMSRVLRFRRRAAQAEAGRLEREIGRARLDVTLEASLAFFMLYEKRRMLEVFEAQLDLARDLVRAATARYGAAQGTQSEVLRAESEAARREAELAALRAEERAAQAMLNAALGRDARRTVPRLAPLDVPETVPARRAVDVALEARPELAAGRAAIARAEAQVDVMRTMRAPMGMLGVGGARTMEDGPGIMAMFGLTVPIFRNRIRGGIAEARAMLEMARADLDAMRLMTAGQAASASAELAAALRRFEAFRGDVVPRSRQAVDSTLAAYAAAQVPLVSVLDAAQSLWMAQESLVDAEIALGMARARLERAIGRSGAGTR